MAKKSEAEVIFKATDDGMKSTLKGITAEMQKNKAEAKLMQAQLKLTGSDSDKLASNLKTLEKAYELQGQKVEVTSERLANAKKFYGENSVEAQRLEKELINLQTGQQNLANSIDTTKQALSESTSEVKTYASSMSELDAKQNDLQKSAELVESEYKKWSATSGKTATDSEKLAKSQEYVAKQSQLAEQKIEVMRQKLDATQKEFGETSTEAKEMAIKLNEAETEFAQLGEAAEKVDTTGVDDLGKKMDMSNLMQASEQLANIGDKLIDVGKNSIEAAASQQALQAQFDQVFGDGADKAQKMVDDMASEFNMLPNRVKPNFTKLTAMFQGLGMDQSEAMESAAQATTLAADAAAFYDQSMEDAQGSLTSFLKGNYEGGESIGIFANDTQMAAFAIKNNLIPATEGAKEASEKAIITLEKAQKAQSEAIKKHGENSLEARDAALKLKDAQTEIDEELGPQTQKWADLDEKTKQAVRLEYAENMQKLSGATGQASREADGYENVMGNLKQAQEDFYATVGTPILETFTSSVQKLTGFMSTLSDIFTNLPGPVQNAIFIIGGLLAGFAVLSPIIASMITVITTLAGIMSGPVVLGIAAVVGAVAGAIAIFTNWGAISDWVSEKWGQFSSWVGKNWDGIKSKTSETWGNISSTVKNKASEMANGAKEKFNTLKNDASEAFGAVKKFASEKLNAAKNTVSDIITKIKNLFSFKLKFPEINIPHIPLPHFKLSGSFNPLKMQIPKLSIDWYAKGGLFDGPNVIGVGEAGKEAVLPLKDRVLGTIGQMISKTMPAQENNNSEQNITNNFTIEIGDVSDPQSARQMVDELMERITDAQRGKNTAFE
nr:hypothetical protein [Enterococcus nangangensis]